MHSQSNCSVNYKVIKNFIDKELVDQCCKEIQRDKGNWITYKNDLERKTTCNDPNAFGEKTRELLDRMQGEFVAEVEKHLGISPLMSDPLLHGGGIHISSNGGMLAPHLDYAKHPRLPLLERRANAILYLVPYWLPEWGGATYFTKPDGRTVIDMVYPEPGKLLLFETNDLSYHSVQAVTSPVGTERITMATYYLSHIREGVTRERALFVPSR